MSEWMPIETAPRDGSPVWVRGWDWGKTETTMHFGWAYWNDKAWRWAGSESGVTTLTHLVEWLPMESSAPPTGASQ